jgi:tetratricopeptide (TPR) repeat protein
MATALLAATVALVMRSSANNFNRWYDLAMERATIEPTLTRDALPQDGRVYINPDGLAIARFAGQLPARHTAGETARLGREPRLWRAQDRQARYDTVWLLGNNADYAPLALHLGESVDWRLAAVDAAGLLFVRGRHEAEFPTEPAQQLARGMVGAANRTRFLADAALACLAAQALPEAGELSRTATRKSDLSSSAAAAHALVLSSLGQVREALAESQRAVALAPRSSEAWETRAQTLLRAGMNNDAYAASQRAAELAPGDAAALWLAARAAHAAHAFQAEAETLERLADLTEGRGGDAGFYLFYLGQSYAKQGLARPALRALEKAAQAPGLTDEQKREIAQEIAEIRSSAGTQ